MGKSLTETAKAVLLKENILKEDPTALSATLKPKSKYADAPKKVDGEVQDLGPALVTPDGESGPAKAADKMGKDKSKSSKAAVAPEPMKEDKVEEKKEVVSEKKEDETEIEMTEELETFIRQKVEEGLSEEDIEKAIYENFEIVQEDTETKDEVVAEENVEDKVEDKPEPLVIDMSEHVEALLQGEELSEAFKEKAKTILEAAVSVKVEAETKRLEAEFAAALSEQVKAIQENLSAETDSYLSYVIENWISENEVAIESGLRTELTEDFINGLHNLFVENYIDFPEGKVDVLESMASRVGELENKLNETIEQNVALTKSINESKKVEVIQTVSEGLTDTQTEKLKSLSEKVDFTTITDYTNKIKTLRENYFSKSPNTDKVIDNIETDKDGKSLIAEDVSSPMKKYVDVLGRRLPN